jgi:diguanylate cyclase (GGDEF)-like protein
MHLKMDTDALLDSMRGLIIVVLRDGTIEQARGGFGGFLGLDVASLPGTNVFEHVPPADADELALYFIESVDESASTIALPLPFRMAVVDPDGFAHPVDVIPTGKMIDGDDWSWTVLLIPVALNGSNTRSLDLEIGGAPRDAVRKMLCEELRVDNANYTSRWLLIDLAEPDSPNVIVARPVDQLIADAVSVGLQTGWQPWDGLSAGASASVDVTAFPDGVRAVLDERGWTRSIVAPVFVHGKLSAAFLLVGRVPSDYDPMSVKRNVAARIQSLVRATTMLIERWNDQDRLHAAATTDELTGLINRRELFARLGSERRTGSLLYVDVDDFKSVNDRLGHTAGDEVLVQLARRIESVCRPQDGIGRVGGDEFVVVLPGADAELADQIARRIVESVDDLRLESGLTVSVSVGSAPLDVKDPLDAADQAMLRAKRRRREVAGSGPA